ncbi:MAG: argininosuccinate lyase [Thermodesulfobacteriota bacterium]|nr:argininosuccinate lyase [Thermodesulfobacteriota bacterium]
MSDKPWGGRFSQSTDKTVETFTSSIDVDKALYAYDIKGSAAHVKMLAHEKIITEDEASVLLKGLSRVEQGIEQNEMVYSDALEDIHMQIETALGREIGDTAKKLHTGRSRNDQIALDVRMYLKTETETIMGLLLSFQSILVDTAKNNMDVVMPGYTHLQRAQPVLFSHHLMAYYEMFKRDYERFEDSLKRTDVMPLGSAALAGTTFPLNRQFTGQLLGFNRISDNSMDSVSDRDFVMEFISHAAIAMIHLSRFSEELVLWSSSEFSFIMISDAFTTGSSIMPQKKNPDVAELVRGKTARVVGSLMAIITLMKSLPLAYNRDMQEDKEPLFDTVNTLKSCLDIYCRMIPGIQVNRETMYTAAQKGFLNATDLADYLVVKGMPFRQAHSVSGNAVAFALNREKELHELDLEDFKQFSELIDQDIYEFLSIENMISRRITHGSTGYDNVKTAVERAEKDIQSKTSGK